MKKWILAVALGGAAYILLFEPVWGLRANRFLSRPALRNVLQGGDTVLPSAIPIELTKNGYVGASLFSSYPFGFKNEILVSAGRAAGVGVGDAVFVPVGKSGKILLGKIEKVFSESALMMTLFDSRFSLAVRVGSSSVDALLTGGNDPILTLIPKNAAIEKGSVIYSAGAGAPYGVPVGVVGEIRSSANALFNEAQVAVPYDTNILRDVMIKKNAGD